ncbi:hypothetical protein GIY62_19840 [Burkholderia plantarii]|uniref:hypothetical protein n=1 Tax=Burkholderia plantarii TaxID=41899 RepID=UPI00272D6415|nr:hypothetical protein [Burkholderia plantarii]WLE62653.1 hypothetical protein GIY62_19840 [Burkholderia plantarii]
MPASATLAQASPVTDLVALGVLALLYVCGLGWAGWQALRATRGRLYWVICVALLAAGALAMAIARPDTPDSGEMPAGFALGVLVAFAGLVATAAGCAWQAIRKLRDPRS